MSEETPPVGQDSPPAPGSDWEARFKGVQPKYQSALETIKAQQGDLATKTSEVEQLRAQIAQMAVEKDTVAATWSEKVKELTEQNLKKDTELVALRRQDHIIQAAKEAGVDDILPILSSIPYSEDREVQIKLIKDLSEWAGGKVKARETQLLAGETPPTTLTGTQPAVEPVTPEGWQAHIAALPVGSQARMDAMNKMFAWGQAQKGA